MVLFKDTFDFAAYVAKDTQYGRACFVLECGDGRAQDVITTIGQAFELRFKEFLRRAPRSVKYDFKILQIIKFINRFINVVFYSLENSHFNGISSSSPSTNCTAVAGSFLPQPPPNVRSDDREYYNDLPGKIPPDLLNMSNTTNNNLNQNTSQFAPAPRKKNSWSDGSGYSVNHLIDLHDEQQQGSTTKIINENSSLLPNSSTLSMDFGSDVSASSSTSVIPYPQYVNCVPTSTIQQQEKQHNDPFDMRKEYRPCFFSLFNYFSL